MDGLLADALAGAVVLLPHVQAPFEPLHPHPPPQSQAQGALISGCTPRDGVSL